MVRVQANKLRNYVLIVFSGELSQDDVKHAFAEVEAQRAHLRKGFDVMIDAADCVPANEAAKRALNEAMRYVS